MDAIETRIRAAEARLAGYWDDLETRCHNVFERVLDGFHKAGVRESHFASVTGYGHHDEGRDAVDAVFANALQAEAALVRLQMVSGTHAIRCALQGALGDGRTRLLSLTGAPYDTLEEVIGIRGDSSQSLIRLGASYDSIDVLSTGKLDTQWSDAQREALRAAHVAFIQRSRGYSLRPSLGTAEIGELIRAAKAVNPGLVVVVDNCYGEFTEVDEPTTVGADLIAGSLIKNPGGGIVTTGGYIAGGKAYVAAAADVLTAPGIGADGGYTFEATRTILQGLYFAPSVTRDALKTMSLAAELFSALGYTVTPANPAERRDIIQAIQLGSPEKILAFCRALQSVSPVDSHLTPIPAVTPGYADAVVMAGGTFIFGSTIELSADAPMREPYTVFLQGGLTYTHGRYAMKRLLAALDS